MLFAVATANGRQNGIVPSCISKGISGRQKPCYNKNFWVGRVGTRSISMEAEIDFIDYMQNWLKGIRPTVATSTFQSNANMLNGRMERWFRPQGITLKELRVIHIENFYQSIFDEEYTANTVSITMRLLEEHCRMR